MAEKPQPFPTRLRDGQWEVLIAPPEMWLRCDSEADAKTIARSIVLRHELLEGVQSGAGVESECRRTADVLAKYRIHFLSRWFAGQCRE